MKRSRIAVLLALATAIAIAACVEPPPKIPAVPASGLALRLYVFGASSVDAHKTFAAVKENNPSFSLVNAGGNGEVLVGLENDSPRCVTPTAMCSYRVSYRIRDGNGAVIAADTTSIGATSTSCTDICSRALTNVAVQIVELAATKLAEASAHAAPDDDAGAADADPQKHAKAKAKTHTEPSICVAAHGARLPSEEAERRAAQVEVLKRLEVVDQDEYDCLRKAYLERL